MNSVLLYQWNEMIDKGFPQMGRWQKQLLGEFSYGVISAQSCRLNTVAQELTGCANASSQERRMQRWLANDRIEMKPLFGVWIDWVLRLWGKAPLVILVDETKLSNHVAVMMVGVAYHASAIPLIWRAYSVEDYPEEGQVALMNELLAELRHHIPSDQTALLLADRGLGTSPAWQERLSDTGWQYLLRVQRSTLIRLPGQKPQPLRRLVAYGHMWSGRAQVFKKAGWQWKWVYLVWEVGYAEPWCLFSNQADLSTDLYSHRFYHEASFRDLKSDGFQWQRSRVWLPAHVERLLLVLACATLWSLTEGTKVHFLYPLARRQQRLSVFRLGLDYLFERFRSLKSKGLELFLAPDPPLIKSVVP
ncbi:MAG: transposase [Chloroflexi bacterium]|nr:transposase [Chloroflexota bacterium]MCC6894972.1 transposase [Anaerolineae bacterium]